MSESPKRPREEEDVTHHPIVLTSGDKLGVISEDNNVRDWVLKTPKCPKCDFFITVSFSGVRNDVIWPHCSNVQCSLHQSVHTFIRPGTEKK